MFAASFPTFPPFLCCAVLTTLDQQHTLTRSTRRRGATGRRGWSYNLVFMKLFFHTFLWWFLFCFSVENNGRNTPSQTVHHTTLGLAQSYWFLVPFSLFILSKSPCWITYWTWTEAPGTTDGTDTEIIEGASLKNNQHNWISDGWCGFKRNLIRKMPRL